MTDVKDKDITLAKKIAELVDAEGGRSFYVGGFVRDRLVKRDNKDVDIEIHGVSPAKLEEILDSFGERMEIGESFGIYNIKGYSLDIAMPRKEENRGSGHRDFDICVDPFIGTQKAAIRRDFTINSLMEDVLTGEVVDHFGGLKDLESGIIRHINDLTFAEDPLRVLRAAQFAARFNYKVADETVEICRTMDLSSLPCERIIEEMKKALLKADKPSIFFNELRKMDQLGYWFKELKDLIGIEQNKKFHSEGDVYNHTMMVIDEAAKLRDKVDNKFAFMLSAVVHDFGKAICTQEVNGVIHAYEHETAGIPLVEKFMARLTSEVVLGRYVVNMTRLHMKPNKMVRANSKIKNFNKMFDESVEPVALIYLAIADDLGRIKESGSETNEEVLFEKLDVFNEYMSRPYVMGQDLIDAGLKPSSKFSEYLAYAHKLRLAGVTKESALNQTLIYAKKADSNDQEDQ